jgi:hypothetical protein
VFLPLHLEDDYLSSAALSMLPWPRPAVWPAVPPDISRVQAKEQVPTVSFFHDTEMPNTNF